MTTRHERRKRQVIFQRLVPQLIADVERRIRESRDIIQTDAFEAPYILASYFLLQSFVSRQVARLYMPTFEDGADIRMTATAGTRLTTIGETIYELRNVASIVEFADRIATRDPQSAFHEALSARIFLEQGFLISAVQESGVKGQDFDFRATRGKTVVCVEVTTLQPTTFSDNTLANALGKKVSQLPPNRPCVIVLVLPESWYRSEVQTTARLVQQAKRLFGASKRVNLLVFLSEQHTDVDAAGGAHEMLQYRITMVPNENPRSPCPELGMLRNGGGPDLGAMSLAHLSQAEVHKTFRDRPFFNWVDGLIERSV